MPACRHTLTLVETLLTARLFGHHHPVKMLDTRLVRDPFDRSRMGFNQRIVNWER